MHFFYFIIFNFFLLSNSSFSHTSIHINQIEKEFINLQSQENQLIKKKYTKYFNTILHFIYKKNNFFKKLSIKKKYQSNQSYVHKTKIENLSFQNRKKLIYDFLTINQKDSYYLDKFLSIIHNQIRKKRQKKAESILEKIEEPIKNNQKLPLVISNQLRINKDLFNILSQQNQQMESILIQKKIVHSQIVQVRHVLNTLYEQSKWLKFSNLVGEALRTQLIHLPSPEVQKSKSVDNQIGDLHARKLIYQNKLDHEKDMLRQCFYENKNLDKNQKNILIYQLKHRNNLLNLLILGCDNLIAELNKLRVSRDELKNILFAVKESTHRYLFWTADISPISFYYPIEVVHAFFFIFSPNIFSQLYNSLLMIFSKKETLITIIISFLFILLSLRLRKNFLLFLENTANQVGKVTQDHFYITLFTVFLSIIITAPPILLCATLGTALQRCWSYPISVSLGKGIISILPLLFIFMVSAAFAEKNGLFLTHFQWSYNRVTHSMRYYRLIIWFIVPLIMLMVTFANFEEHQLSATLGRLCFICICGALSVVTSSFKRADIPLYLDKEGNCKNLINYFLWNLMIAIPILSAFAACIGYLETAKALLAKLEISVAIWFSLLVIYYIIRRWMLIQKRRIAFDRARQKRAEILANRSRSEEEKELLMQNADSVEIDEPIIDLDKISSQSLRLVRSILTLIALLSVIILWSDIHSAFSFLENIHLWEVKRTVSNVNHIYPITLSSILITVLIFFITAQLVRNMPALLELAILQHISLKPGTGYAITTLTKYFLMFIGGVIGFSFIGVEWAKLQWLVAALGVGLGFGLQEIFANFISGLIILFEKPIRIGDTVTLRDLTGSITRINTRATTIIDWDRKEIIIPNKAFITEQFINWSLSDSVTRIVLTIPASTKESTEKITAILKKAAEMCSYVLTIPSPEVFLVDLQKGIQLFELRIYAAEIGHRMPLRHELHQLILKGFKENNIDLPFPPTQIRMEIFHKK